VTRTTIVSAVLLAAGCSSSRPAHAPRSEATASTITRPRICAHRGASIDAPENTLAAFQLAWDQGVEAIELDVRLSRDGEVVVIHDATTARTAGLDRPVAEQTLAELRALDAGAWHAPRFAGERVPTLREVLDTVPDGGTVFVELKSGPETADAVANVIRVAHPGARGGRIALQGYDPDALARLAAAVGDAPAYWTVDPPARDEQLAPYAPHVIDEARARGFAGLALDYRGVTDELVAAAREAGLLLDVWTINDAAIIRAWLAKDIRWIETDKPDLAPSGSPIEMRAPGR
jgi:glycerophosphoryl diester phosphodiesterase